MSRDPKLTWFSQERKTADFKITFSWRFLGAGSGTHFMLTQITLHECTHTTWQGCPDVGNITVGGHNDFYSPTRPPRNPGWHRGPRPCCACGGRGGGRNLAAATWAPSACFPHPLFPTGPGSGSSFCESPRRGGRGVWRSYFRAIREGGRRGRGVEVEAAQKAQCLLLFHPTEGSICGSEQTLGIRAGRGKEKGKKKKATSTTTHRSSPELPRGGE